ncbi:GNAT family N-acetyltransferase [Thermoactinospora rubra]|uniref:GNAT family N-acetyltransferase n=1 Tax=Thermoactinospora rubra TaxID=1088767 RepID=UPI000A122078|nr:GNAT family N-acetyltransferase [Thermoactinospora rubra]
MEEIAIRPASSWPDVAAVFGPRGAYGGCWCMWFRTTDAQFRQIAGEQARERLRGLVESAGPAPGLLAYLDGTPVGWCAVAPREDYVRIGRSPVVKPVDPAEEGVWSVPCFFVTPAGRGRGVPAALLRAAIGFARSHGARALEGYPRDTGRRVQAAELYYGWRSLFEGAGFREIARRSPTRPIMRLDL